jgi:type IV pilus assembly protein PilB
LADLLVEQRRIDRFEADQLLAKIQPPETFADRLVTDGKISEEDLLRLLAEKHGTRFVMSTRIKTLKVDPEILSLIPMKSAVDFDSVPIGMSQDSTALFVVMADPSLLANLQRSLPASSKLPRVAAYIGLSAPIHDAMRRFYVLSPRHGGLPLTNCSSCLEPVSVDQVECAACGLLLRIDPFSAPSVSGIVRALLESPVRDERLAAERQVYLAPTKKGPRKPITQKSVPSILGGIDMFASLSEFEALVVSMIDGTTPVAGLQDHSGLSSVELLSLLSSLSDRGVLRLNSESMSTQPALIRPAPPILEPVLPEKTHPHPHAVAQPPSSISNKTPAPRSSRPIEVSPQERAQHQAENVIQAATRLEKRGDIAGAVFLLKNAIAQSPRPAPLYNRLAIVLLTQRADSRQAEELLNKAVDLEPENQVYKDNLVKVLASRV